MKSVARRCFFVLLLFVLNPIATTQPSAQAAGPSLPLRIVVKLKAPAQAAAADARIADFRARHGIDTLQPVYEARNRVGAARRMDDRQLTAGVRRRFAARARRQSGGPVPELSSTFNFQTTVASRAELANLLARLAADPDVAFAEEDTVAGITFIPDDPYYSTAGTWGQNYDDLYGLKKIGAATAWDSGAGQGVTVAVVDTGADYTHPDLANNIWINANEIPGNGIDDDENGYVDDVRGWDFIGASYWNPVQDADPADGHGHGTHVAGTIAAEGNNGVGVIGVAWQSKIMPVKGLDDGGTAYSSQLASAIVYAADNGADVINASWGGYGTSQTIQDAVDYAVGVGVVFVAAAGNSADDARKYYPAGLGSVITVAASDAFDQLAYFSNWGPKIDVAAPGVDILSLRAQGTSGGTPVGDGYTRMSGTSMATPHVAGIAALVLGQYPTYSTSQVRQAIRVSAADIGAAGFDETFGYGRADAGEAIAVSTALNAALVSPADGLHVTGPVLIEGFAYGTGFASYELAYGVGTTPSQWTTFHQSTEPGGGGGPAPNIPVPGPLGTLDTSLMPDGVYTIRLSAFDQSGRAYIDRRSIVVDYVRLTNPPSPFSPAEAATLKAGMVIPIEGMAIGPSFIGFRIEWARGINPGSGWSAAGISLEQNGSLPISGGVLGTWDTSALTDADYYTIRLAVDNAGFTSEAQTLVYLEPDLLSSNWPKALIGGSWPDVEAYPARGSAGQRMLAIHSFANPFKLRKFLADGSSVETIEDPAGGYSPFQAAVAELDGQPGDEFVVGHSQSLRVFRPDGTSYLLPAPAGYSLWNAIPVIEDIVGTAEPEVLAVATDQSTGTGRLQAWNAGGTPLGGAFPVAIADQNRSLYDNTTVQRLIAADLDGDGAKEIVLAEGPTPSTVWLHLLSADGTLKPYAAPPYDGRLDKLAAADIDADGGLEVLVLMRNPDSTRTLHVLAVDGSEKPGWPFNLGGGKSGLALADLDRDGQLEIVLPAAYTMHVLRSNGQTYSSAWPRGLTDAYGAYYLGPAVTADMDGDGTPEIIVPTFRPATYQTMYYYEHKIVVFRGDGTVMRSWRVPSIGGEGVVGVATPLIADVNGDGQTDIVITAPIGAHDVMFLSDSLLAVLTTGSPSAAADDWPSQRHDSRNTAALPRDSTPPAVTLTSPDAGATIVDTITVTATASDDVFVRGVQFKVDGVDIGAEDLLAPYEVSWNPRPSGNGPHVLTAVARDVAGNLSTSAPVDVIVDADVTPPEVAITSPTAGTTVSSLIAVLADASDNRSVDRTELYVDGALVATDATAPYELWWNPQTVGDGQHTLVVNAVDAAGNVGTSQPVDVVVNVAPQATWSAPSPGAVISAPVSLQVAATDNSGVVRVDFFANGAPIGSDTAAPWSITWDASAFADGSYTLGAIAYDAASNTGGAEIPVTVNHPPTASITSPASGVTVSGPIQISASASDAGGINRVELLINGVLTATDTDAPYSFDWNPAGYPDGWQSLVARAYDTAGNAGSSAAVSVRVMIAPSVAITSPASGALLAGIVTVTATATDNVGVVRTELYVDGVLAMTDTTAPWAFSLDTNAYADGPHTLVVKAADAAGNIGTSSGVPVSTDNDLATYDPVLKAPQCGTVQASCSSGSLLNGRNLKGPEPNQPNTIYASCSDGGAGTYHYDESNDRITVSTLDGSPLGIGKTVRVRATVWAYSSFASDQLDLYYTSNAVSPVWTLIGTFTPTGAGAQTIAATYTLPAGGLQAVRARFRYGGTAAPCGTGSYDDHDDLAFAVDSPPDSGPPTVAITSPGAGATLTTTTTITADATDDIGVTRVELWIDGFLNATDTTAPYAFTWNPAFASDGGHSLVAKAYDAAGNVTASTAVPVTVAVPPTVSITSPSAGATVSGVVTVTASASDNTGVSRVDFFVDGTLRSTDSATPYNFSWNTAAEAVGPHTLTAKAYDPAGNEGISAPVTVQVQAANPSDAVYDATLKAPRCSNFGAACDSVTLLVGRASKGPEPNAPNTIYSSCADGTYGTFHYDESNDRIRVTTLDGTDLAAGKIVRIEATVWAYTGYSSDKLDLYYTANASSPVWTYITTLTPTKAGAQVLSATYTLPAGALQAVRANFRYGGAAGACTTGGYDDRDDLTFAVR